MPGHPLFFNYIIAQNVKYYKPLIGFARLRTHFSHKKHIFSNYPLFVMRFARILPVWPTKPRQVPERGGVTPEFNLPPNGMHFAKKDPQGAQGAV